MQKILKLTVLILLIRDDQNDELIAVITTVPISQPYIPHIENEESEKS